MSTPAKAEPLWSHPVRPLPRLVGDHRADICVVGLGASGLSALRRLLPSKARLVGIDAVGVGAGAAGRNGGFLLSGGADFYHRLRARIGPSAKRLYELSVEARDRIVSDTPGIRRCGSLRLPADEYEEEDCHHQLAAMVKDGLEASWRPQEGGLLVPGDATHDPAARCRYLAEQVADRVTLFGHSPALEIVPESVVSESGTIRAEVVLVCIDGRLERAMPELAHRMRSVRLQMLATAAAPDVRVNRAIYHRFGLDYWQQRPDGRIALGGGRDVGGEEEETDQLGVTEAVQARLECLLRERVGTAAQITHRWSGIVAYSRDGLPIVEEVGRGIFAAGAYSGHGNVLGTLAGESLAELALGRATPGLVGALRAAREYIAAADADGEPEPDRAQDRTQP